MSQEERTFAGGAAGRVVALLVVLCMPALVVMAPQALSAPPQMTVVRADASSPQVESLSTTGPGKSTQPPPAAAPAATTPPSAPPRPRKATAAPAESPGAVESALGEVNDATFQLDLNADACLTPGSNSPCFGATDNDPIKFLDRASYLTGIGGVGRLGVRGAIKASGLFGSGRAASSTATRADEIHRALDPIARGRRTTAVLRTKDSGGKTVDVLAGGARDLSPAQRAL